MNKNKRKRHDLKNIPNSVIDEIISMYSNNMKIIDISNHLSICRESISKILKGKGIKVSSKGKRLFSDEHRAKISDSRKGKKTWMYGRKATRKDRLKNMVGHLYFEVTFEWLNTFEDVDKLIVLNKALRKENRIGWSDDLYIDYINTFYYDKSFNFIYEKWLRNNKNKWLSPSIDHIIPKSKGAIMTDLKNLQFLTWFENRAKCDMSQDEWSELKNNINEYIF